MTNNYEENILKGVKDSSYSLESSLELLQKDVVQLHAPRYQSMRRVSVGTQSGLLSTLSVEDLAAVNSVATIMVCHVVQGYLLFRVSLVFLNLYRM